MFMAEKNEREFHTSLVCSSRVTQLKVLFNSRPALALPLSIRFKSVFETQQSLKFLQPKAFLLILLLISMYVRTRSRSRSIFTVTMRTTHNTLLESCCTDQLTYRRD